MRAYLAVYFNGLRIARLRQPQIVVGYNFTPYGVLAWLVARLSGQQVVVSLIGADFNSRLRLLILGRLLKRILRDCDAGGTHSLRRADQLHRDRCNHANMRADIEHHVTGTQIPGEKLFRVQLMIAAYPHLEPVEMPQIAPHGDAAAQRNCHIMRQKRAQPVGSHERVV